MTFEMNSKPCCFARHVCHLGTGHHGFRRSAAGIHAGATQDFPFDQCDRLARPGKSCSKKRSGLPRANDDRIECAAHVASLLAASEKNGKTAKEIAAPLLY